MSDDPATDPPEPFEAKLDAGLDHIASAVPVADPPTFDANRPATATAGGTVRPSPGVLLAAAAAVVVLVVAGALLVARGSNDTIRSGPATSETTLPAPTTADTQPGPTTAAATATEPVVADTETANSVVDPPVTDTSTDTASGPGTNPATGPATSPATDPANSPATDPAVPSLDEIVTAQRAALQQLPGFSATATIATLGPDGEPTTQVVRYTLLPDGSFYADTGPDTFGSYDPATGTVLGAFRDFDGQLAYQEILGQSDNSLPLGILGGHDPTFLISSGSERPPAIRAIRFDGRPAWELTAVDSYPSDDGTQVVRTTVQVVDRDTGLVVRNATTSDAPDAGRTTELSDIEIADTMPAEFPGSFPAGADVRRDGAPGRVRPATLADVADVFGPSVPLPNGFSDGTIVDADGPATVVISESPMIVGDSGPGDEPNGAWVEARITVRRGFVATTVSLSGQRLSDGAPVPPGWAQVDGFLCDDLDDDGVCGRPADDGAERIRAGALAGLPVYIEGPPGYTAGYAVLGGVNISVYGTDRPTTIAIFEAFAD